MSSEEEFLRRKYNLHQSDEAESAAQRHEKRTGEAISRSNADTLVQNYFGRFKEILDRPDPAKKEQGLTALKQVLHKKFVINEEGIPESYWEGIRRIARERGQGADLEQVDWEMLKHQTADGLIADQRASLDVWIDYLSSSDAPYPDWLKYFAVRSILNMGEYDKEKKKFIKRSKGTVKPYPDINREALALVLDALQKKIAGEETDEQSEEFQKLLQTENFAKLYAHAIEECTPASQEQLESTAGRWVMYPQGSDHILLASSIQGHGTGWCTAGESTAKAQLEQGNFHVYYSNDANGNPTIPRAAIRMKDGNIAEVRGIAEQQNLDASIAPVVEKKLQEFPDGKAYNKKVSDMKHLTAIERKHQAEEPLTKDDVSLLYEINAPIEGFGYEKDPRIAEIRSHRKQSIENDMYIFFGDESGPCRPDQIAHHPSEINKEAKAYVGPVVKGLFDAIPDSLEHIYTSFPEGRIRLESLEIGSMTADELEQALESADIKTRTFSKSMLRNKKQFIDPVNKRHAELQGETETLDLVRLRVRDLAFTSSPTTRELLGEFDTEGNLKKNGRIHELGFELCPPETGPYKRLADTEQPLGDWYSIGIQPVAVSDGKPRVFRCGRREDGAWLRDRWADPGTRWWNLDDEIVLRRRKSVA